MQSYNVIKLFLVLIFFQVNLTINSYAAQQDEEEKKLYKQALTLYNQEYFDYALPLYLKLLEKHPNDPEFNLAVGICYINSSTYRVKSLPYLEDAIAAGDTIPEAFYYLAQAYHLANDFDNAIKFFKRYKTYLGRGKNDEAVMEDVDREIEMVKNAKEFFTQKMENELVNVGPPVSSKYAEYTPLVPVDESFMIFTYRGVGCKGGKRGFDGQPDSNGFYNEDIFISYKKDDQWTQPVGISDSINTDLHDACIGLSKDGKKLFLFKSNQFGTGDLWESKKYDDGTWSAPTRFPEPVNSRFGVSSASLTYNDSMIYFSSFREDSRGGKDIYVSTLRPNGTWSTPKNLGSKINTEYDEDAPFITGGGKILYFSSLGHKSMGGYDIFKSELIDGKWSDPVNIGFPVNTTDDDLYFVLTAGGKKGYFSSERVRHCLGQQDIYMVNMEVAVEDTPRTAIIKGKITNGDEPLEAEVKITDENGENIGEYITNSRSGRYLFPVPMGGKYTITVSTKGQPERTREIDLNKEGDFDLFVRDFDFSAEDGEGGAFGVVVYFAFNKSEVDANGHSEIEKLDKLIRYLERHNKAKIELFGHTDAKGSAKYNQQLSEKRNEAVHAYLLEHGIAKDRINSMTGFGEDKPKKGNDTEEDRSFNRRVEVSVIE